ncbi:MAG: prepilin-type N-terminal cleavage/methylation domain-containing protein [Dehalococcoidales bacterium]|nr:prepilin-type N-terminal cleavage/methylation domain-containing protein [Dehalococcoidales bacterium]
MRIGRYAKIEKRAFFFRRSLRLDQKGFTLIELLIIIAILAILAVVALANVGNFVHISRVNAANTELESVQKANQAYAIENKNIFATSSAELDNKDYLSKPLKGTYEFDSLTGFITGTPISGYDGVTWNASLSRFD